MLVSGIQKAIQLHIYIYLFFFKFFSQSEPVSDDPVSGADDAKYQHQYIKYLTHLIDQVSRKGNLENPLRHGGNKSFNCGLYDGHAEMIVDPKNYWHYSASNSSANLRWGRDDTVYQ